MILAPVIRDRKGEHQGVLEEIRRQGFVRVRVDGNVLDIDEAVGLDLAKTNKHTIEVVVDRLVIRHEEGTTPDDHPDRVRVIESLETALKIASGIAEAQIIDGEADRLLREVRLPGARRGRPDRDRAAQLLLQLAARRLPGLHRAGHDARVRPRPDHAEPESVAGAGGGRALAAGDRGGERLVQRAAGRRGREVRHRSRRAGARSADGGHRRHPQRVAGQEGHRPLQVALRVRTRSYDVVYEGVIPNLKRRYEATSSDYVREELERYMAERPCPACHGARLKPEVLGVTVGERSIVDVDAAADPGGAGLVRGAGA